MKTIKNLFASLAMLMIATSVLAQESSCMGDTCVDVEPLMNNLLTIDVTSFGLVAGEGLVTGLGDEFTGLVEKESKLRIDTEVEGQTDMCAPNCTDFTVSFDGLAVEKIESLGLASSITPGELVSVSNASQALSQLGISIDISDFGDGN